MNSTYAIIETPQGALEALPAEDGMTYQKTGRLLKKLDATRKEHAALIELVRDLYTGAQQRSQSHADVMAKIEAVVKP